MESSYSSMLVVDSILFAREFVLDRGLGRPQFFSYSFSFYFSPNCNPFIALPIMAMKFFFVVLYWVLFFLRLTQMFFHTHLGDILLHRFMRLVPDPSRGCLVVDLIYYTKMSIYRPIISNYWLTGGFTGKYFITGVWYVVVGNNIITDNQDNMSPINIITGDLYFSSLVANLAPRGFVCCPIYLIAVGL